MHKRSELITTVTVLLWLSWYPQIVGIFLQFEPFMKPRILSQGTAIPLFWRTYFNSVWTQIFQIVGIFLHFQRKHILMNARSDQITTTIVLLWLRWYHQIVGIFLQFEPFMKHRLLSKLSVIQTFWRTDLNSFSTQIFQIVGIFLHFPRW